MINRHCRVVGIDHAMKRRTLIRVVGHRELRAVHRVMSPVLHNRDNTDGDVFRRWDCRKCISNDVTCSNNDIPIITANRERSTTVQYHLAITSQCLVVRQNFERVGEGV